VIPAAFDYHRAHSVDEAFAHLTKYGSDARVLAGGQSLIPAMRFRLARPGVLVDINPVAELSHITLDGALTIGATARDAAIERAAWIGEPRWSLIHDVSRVVADPVVRQMATIVGSLCHNDPAGDWTTVALASRAEVIVRGAKGPRTVPIDAFLVDSFATAVGDGEMALAVRFPAPDDRSAGSYQKVERKVGDFATAAAAVTLRMKGETVSEVAIALTNVGPTPLKARAAEDALRGKALTDASIALSAGLAMKICQPVADQRGDVEYRTAMAGEMTQRALRVAFSRATR